MHVIGGYPCTDQAASERGTFVSKQSGQRRVELFPKQCASIHGSPNGVDENRNVRMSMHSSLSVAPQPSCVTTDRAQ